MQQLNQLDISAQAHTEFAAFAADPLLFALPLVFSNETLEPRPAIGYPKKPDPTFQLALSQLESILDSNTPQYILLRRNDNLVAITYVPHLADEEAKKKYLSNRYELVRGVGETHFSSSLISKEAQEITDVRSWNERDENDQSRSEACEIAPGAASDGLVKDLGYRKNRCRLCDRRMKYKIEEQADEALLNLKNDGNCVQLFVDVPNETLVLNFAATLPQDQVSKRLPAEHPSFTFYRHPENKLLYFIWCSPDGAPVKERMTHTMAIAGLVNVIAKDNGVVVDQKVEIHEPEDLNFGMEEKPAGKFRSMYLRDNIQGTESTWGNMEQDQKVLDSIR
ncbi:hypothetical protein BS50DRAFT_540004 [Corynespora cassiicola Philippines]|uniref:ADF-H domain-containing protein n=1 Tax=Corynespora cassiicola Philippines TaxID=1448308 RepID=A0A2T2PAD6_CORCC|nr:hypothetical protein BS50DRAFT_540004 [Corynespora cassiicola Philippines]